MTDRGHCVGLATLQRWRRQFKSDRGGIDGRKGSHRDVAYPRR